MQDQLTTSSRGRQSPNPQILNIERLIERAAERVDRLADGLAVLGPKWTRLVELIVEDVQGGSHRELVLKEIYEAALKAAADGVPFVPYFTDQIDDYRHQVSSAQERLNNIKAAVGNTQSLQDPVQVNGLIYAATLHIIDVDEASLVDATLVDGLNLAADTFTDLAGADMGRLVSGIGNLRRATDKLNAFLEMAKEDWLDGGAGPGGEPIT